MSGSSSTFISAAQRYSELSSLLEDTKYATSDEVQNLEDALDVLRARMKENSDLTVQLKAQLQPTPPDGKHKLSRKLFGFRAKQAPEVRIPDSGESSANLQRQEELVAARAAMMDELKTVESKKKATQADKIKHENTEKELDQLFASTFDGPTPEAPQEDDIEEKVASIASAFQEAQSRLDMEKDVLRALSETTRHHADADHDMAQAKHFLDAEKAESKPSKSMLRDWNEKQGYWFSKANEHMKMAQASYASASRRDPASVPASPFDGNPRQAEIQAEAAKALTSASDKFQSYDATIAMTGLVKEAIASIVLSQRERHNEAAEKRDILSRQLEALRSDLKEMRIAILKAAVQS